MATKTSTKKEKKVVKKEPKKVVKKEVKEEEVITKAKLEPVKEEKKQRTRLLTYKQTAILYFVCAACWFISAVLNYIAKVSMGFDVLMGVAFLVIGLLYAANISKDK